MLIVNPKPPGPEPFESWSNRRLTVDRVAATTLRSDRILYPLLVLTIIAGIAKRQPSIGPADPLRWSKTPFFGMTLLVWRRLERLAGRTRRPRWFVLSRWGYVEWSAPRCARAAEESTWGRC